jgi:hypothetical protein
MTKGTNKPVWIHTADPWNRRIAITNCHEQLASNLELCILADAGGALKSLARTTLTYSGSARVGNSYGTLVKAVPGLSR